MADRQVCPNDGAVMRVRERFKFDHEPGDTPRDTESLRLFESMGIDLGADVTLYVCPTCGNAIALFDYSEQGHG